MSFLLLAVTAIASPAATAEPQQPVQKERRICRRMQETGSRMASSRLCLTAEQWRERESETGGSIDALRGMQGRNAGDQ